MLTAVTPVGIIEYLSLKAGLSGIRIVNAVVVGSIDNLDGELKVLRIPRKKVAAIPLFDSNVSQGGIIIPDEAKERCDQGIIKYIGADCELVKEGDHIIFSGYTGTLMEFEGEGLLIILPEDFIVGVLEYEEEQVAQIDVNGLYFKDSQGNYWPATYEFASRLIAKALEESKFFKKITGWSWRTKKSVTQRPELKSYDRTS